MEAMDLVWPLLAVVNCTCPVGLIPWPEGACLCVPCPSGHTCGNGSIRACGPDTWSTAGNADCAPCSGCNDSLVVQFPCSRTTDTQCRQCHEGFRAANGTCSVVPAEAVDPRYGVVIFLVLMVEVLVCASWWKWWITHKTYLPVSRDARVSLRG